MKTVKGILVTLLLLGGVVFVLMNNKAKSDAKAARKDVMTTLPVSVAKVERQDIAQNLSVVGTIAVNSEVTVLSETQGRILRMSFEVGDYVSKGTVLAQVDDELKRTSLAAAQVGYDKAKSDLGRYSQLIGDLAISEQQIEAARLALRSAEIQIASANRLLRDTRITAPVSGIITVRQSPQGSNVMPGTPIVTIVDVSQLKVRVNVSERDVFKLKVGDRVEIATDVHPGMTFMGRIRSISPKSDEAHTYPVEISVANSGSKLKAGMFGRVSFTSVGSVNSLVIPRQALVGSIQKPQVYVVNNGVARLRSIVVSGDVDTRVLVVSGLLAGDQVVVDGQNNLADNAAVSVVK